MTPGLYVPVPQLGLRGPRGGRGSKVEPTCSDSSELTPGPSLVPAPSQCDLWLWGLGAQSAKCSRTRCHTLYIQEMGRDTRNITF